VDPLGIISEARTWQQKFLTMVSWGQRFHKRIFVSQPAMQLVTEQGGHE
jgi:hypothetical protein